MPVIWFVAWREIRRRWGSLLLLAVLVALVSGVVLAGAAGARRTASVVERFIVETDTRDAGGEILAAEYSSDQGRTDDLLEKILDVEGVEDAGRQFVYFVETPQEVDFVVLGSPDGIADRIDRPLLLEGRMPADDAADEVAINEAAAEQLGLEVGDRVTGGTYSPTTIAAVFSGQNPEETDGPPVDLQVVGIVRQTSDLAEVGAAEARGLVSPAFADRADGEIGPTVTRLAIVLAAGADPSDELQTLVQEETGTGQAVVISPIEHEFRDTVEHTASALARGLTVFAVAAGLAGLVAIAQVLGRQTSWAAWHDRELQAMGASPRSRIVVAAVPQALAVLVGVVAGAAAAVLASPLFPLGSARRVEVHPGLDLDLGVGIVGSALLVGVGWMVAFLSAHRVVKGAAPARRPRRSVPLLPGLPPSRSIGAAMAVSTGQGRAGAPTAILGVVVAVAGVMAVSVLIETTRTVYDDPPRWGWTWDSSPALVATDEAKASEALLVDPGVAGAGPLTTTNAAIDGDWFSAYSLYIEEGIPFATLEGRAPTRSREVALGPAILDEHGLEVGDDVELTGRNGDVETMHIVGVAVDPVQDDGDPARAALLTPEGRDDLGSLPTESQIIVSYAPEADRAETEARLTEAGFDFSQSGPVPPGLLQQLVDLDDLLIALAVFLWSLGMIGVLHLLVTAVRRRRHDLAVLRSTGFEKRDVRHVITTHGLVVAFLGTLVGIPLGLLVGRATWLALAGGLAIVDTPVTPWVAVVVMALAIIAGATLLAILPGWWAARRRPGQDLRAE